jgi:hypothetical protein
VSEAKRWSAVATVTWRPVLTFTRRRLELLDWLEREVLDRVVSFTDTPTHLGVYMQDELQRVHLERTSLRVELLSPEASLSSLQPVLDRALELFTEQEPSPYLYFGVWTVPLVGEYDTLRTALARIPLAPEWPAEVAEPFDTAYLVDFRSKVGNIKLEYGVVTGAELYDRLSNQLGRMASTVGLPTPHSSVTPDQMPAVALCVEAFCDPLFAEAVSSFEDLNSFIENVEDVLQQIVYALALPLH